MFNGKSLSLTHHSSGIVELVLNLQNESVNKLNQVTLHELGQALKLLQSTPKIKGLILSSAKDVFVVGADITEFTKLFELGKNRIGEWLQETHAVFNGFEDLEFPTVSLIHGFALGGGCELALVTDYRFGTPSAKIGLPETKLGIIPGWGGTVRLPRLIGADHALEWIAGAATYSAEDALKYGFLDSIIAQDVIRDKAIEWIHEVHHKSIDFKLKRNLKKAPLLLNQIEAEMCFGTAFGVISAKAGKNYPAPITALKTIQKSHLFSRDQAIQEEIESFSSLALSPAADSLVTLFLNDQFVKKKSKQIAKGSQPATQPSVLGAGIMGGGIAFQTSSQNLPIIMKDIRNEALDLGMNEAIKLFEKQREKGKISGTSMAQAIARIHPTLSYDSIKNSDIVIEAVVENFEVKKNVLADLEKILPENAVICSNTSSLPISDLASTLKNPSRFCGMHFFNPVPRMPLVEVIRGKESSAESISKTTSFALALGKTPIVVNDCTGFFVNRVLFPYFGGFFQLIEEGIDFVEIDKIMENFGWPMGPAYLLDVVGLDTACHVHEVMAKAYPERMKLTYHSAAHKLFNSKKFGQKNQNGFYSYSTDSKGRVLKKTDPGVYEILSLNPNEKHNKTSDEIIERLMFPMILETLRCLEEKIIETPAEADLGLIYGLGFPAFRGGCCKMVDQMGRDQFLEKAAKWSHLGGLYSVPEGFAKTNSKEKFYQ